MIKQVVTHLFEKAGLQLGDSDDGNHNEIVVHDDKFFREVLVNGSIGLGDSYIDGLWNSHSVDVVVFKLLKAGVYNPTLARVYDLIGSFSRSIHNLQDRTGSHKVIDKHYNLNPDLFLKFLDHYNQYTCGYFEKTDNLEKAQENKLELICNKLDIRMNDKVLDIGGGWGGLALYMSERFDVNVTMVTLSEQQANYARKLCEGRKVKVYICDYRDILRLFSPNRFDKVTAVGILEHIGHKNYREFMTAVNHALKPTGRCLFQTLYSPTNMILSNPWIRKHIFPNHELPPYNTIHSAASEYFQPLDEIAFQDMTSHYVKTLLNWNERLNKAIDTGTIKLETSEHRTWNFYFLSCAGALRAEHMRVGQLVYQK
ncbi:class I SAM-dependent methyltransferase [Candidatus Woesearchaeota archaeon]|nr:class I SAM-dependent methyltransferase [Candidatus Woesearchaeota archaeon]